MIAKGLDFPNVTLVGVVNADVAMNLPDFRATERTFQLLTQVAGRAGRGPLGGEVFVQTALPEHYAIECAVRHDYGAFATKELLVRARPAYPPHARLANVVISGTDERAVEDGAIATADWLQEEPTRLVDGAVDLIGPAPCPIDRIRGRWRWHFLLRSEHARALGIALGHIAQGAPAGARKSAIRLIIDRDPVTVL
jgi:primosomal protein N' (replication factor Y)